MNKTRNQNNNSINWKIWIGLFISAVFLYLAFREVDLKKTWTVMGSADLFPVLLFISILFFQFIVRAWRWYILLEPIKKTHFSNRITSIFIGFAANNIFPARLGELVRANYIGYLEGMSPSSAFGTIVIERIFDAFTLLMILLIGLLCTTFPVEWQHIADRLRIAGIILFFAYILASLSLIGFKYRTRLFIAIIERIFFFLPEKLLARFIKIIRNFSLGLVPINSLSGWGLASFFSLLVWFCNLVQIQLVEQSIGLDLPFISTFLILSMASFGVMIPSAPGFIGTFHLAVQYGFLFFGTGKEEALSAAIIWHASFFFPTILFGIASFLFLQWFSKKRPETGIFNGIS